MIKRQPTIIMILLHVHTLQHINTLCCQLLHVHTLQPPAPLLLTVAPYITSVISTNKPDKNIPYHIQITAIAQPLPALLAPALTKRHCHTIKLPVFIPTSFHHPQNCLHHQAPTQHHQLTPLKLLLLYTTTPLSTPPIYTATNQTPNYSHLH